MLAATDPNNLRKAALALHALPDPDMQRVWSRLDAAQRDLLSPLLDELSSLGIPKGRQWLDPDEDSAAIQSAIVDEAKRCRAVVWGVRAQQILPVLTTQSLDTAVAVMQSAKWPWLDDVVNAWPPEHRHTVRAKLQSAHSVPVSLADQLLQSMAAALLAKSAVPAAQPAVRSRNLSWQRGIKSLFAIF